MASAQALRDEEELEPWSVAKHKDKDKKKGLARRTVATAGQTASVAAFLTVGGLLVAALMLPGPSPGPGFPSVSLDPGVKRGIIERVGDSIGELVRTSAPVTLQHDFSKGLVDWSTIAVKGTSNIDDPRDWIGGSKSALNHAESLHLWKRSASLQNYQMEFMGQMQRSSLSWAFRASDGQNYYATKLVMTKPGPLPNAALVRYAVVDGREWDRVKLPLPLTLERGVNYNIRVTVQDDRFITYLNDQAISNWSDQRLRRGGVGFFEDADDPQKVAWVSLSERDSFLGRMLAHFSLFLFPGESQE